MGDREPLTTPGLVAAARGAGYTRVTERALEDWRYRGLLPRPQRVKLGDGRTAWAHPAEARDQLLSLCRWRERSRSMEAICVALWVEDHAIGPERARDAISAVLDWWESRIAALRDEAVPTDVSVRERPGTAGFPLDTVAHQLAAMRSRSPFPRRGRMRQEERKRGIAYALALALGMDDEAAARSEDADLLERVIGLRRGRAGIPLALDEPRKAADRAPRLVHPENLRHALHSSTGEELELARAAVRFGMLLLPILIPLLVAGEGRKRAGLTEATNSFRDEAPPESYALLVAIFLSTIVARPCEATRVVLDEMTSPNVDLEAFALLEGGQRVEAFRALPEGDQARILGALKQQKGRR